MEKKKYKETKMAWNRRNPKKMKIYQLKHKSKFPKYYSEQQIKFRFGGNREKVLERDNWQCQECGMTNEQHIILFGRQITIDHIDNNGRYSKHKNNNLDNLQTLCLRCHGRKDVKRRWNNNGKN